MGSITSHYVEDKETEYEIFEDMAAEYELPDITNILLRGESDDCA